MIQVAGGGSPLILSFPHFTNIGLHQGVLNPTPLKCLDLDDNSGQLKLEGWLYVVFIAYTLFHEEALFFWQLEGGIMVIWRGGLILLAISEGRHHFIG